MTHPFTVGAYRLLKQWWNEQMNKDETQRDYEKRLAEAAFELRKPAPVTVCQLLLSMAQHADQRRMPRPAIRLPGPFAEILKQAIEAEYPGFDSSANEGCGKDVVAMLDGVRIVDDGTPWWPRTSEPEPEPEEQAPAAPTFAEAMEIVEQARRDDVNFPAVLVRALVALNVLNLRPDEPVEQPIPPVPDLDDVIKREFNRYGGDDIAHLKHDRMGGRLRIEFAICGLPGEWQVQHERRVCGRGASINSIQKAAIELALQARKLMAEVKAKRASTAAQAPVTSDGPEDGPTIPIEIGYAIGADKIDVLLRKMAETGYRFTRAPVTPAQPHIPQRVLDCLAPDTAKQLASVLLAEGYVIESGEPCGQWRVPPEIQNYFTYPEVITRVLRNENLVIVPEKR